MDHTSEELTNIDNRHSFFKHYQKLITGTACACAAALVLFLGLTAVIDSQVQAIVGLDVNPSIELSVGRSDKVVKVDTVNDDAREIIGNMKLKGSHIDVAVNAIVGAMVQNHYLDSDKGTVLVTVTGKDSAKADVLKSQITTDVKNILTENNIKGKIMNQTIPASQDPALSSVAEKYGISLGKAAFLHNLTQSYPEYTLEQLAPMTMHELYSLIRTNRLDLTGIVDIDDDDDDDDDLLEEIEDFIEDIDETVKRPVNNDSGQSKPDSGTANGNISQNGKPSGNRDDRDDRYDDDDSDDDHDDDFDDNNDDHDDDDFDDNDGDHDDDDFDDIDNDDDDDDDDHDDNKKAGSVNKKPTDNTAAGNQNVTVPAGSNNNTNGDDDHDDSDDDDDDSDDDHDDDSDDEGDDDDDHVVQTGTDIKKDKAPANTSTLSPVPSDENKAGGNTGNSQSSHQDSNDKDQDDDDEGDDNDDDDSDDD